MRPLSGPTLLFLNIFFRHSTLAEFPHTWNKLRNKRLKYSKMRYIL
ncbi:hypothetical protein LEP1GSC165_3636 [Leptospira santarosai str. CBC523]|nr:hypothetical protein LEP1GSC165_3636 [Leptospira santarosai str. CBC523]